MPAGILKVETSKGLADSYAECVEDSPISVQSQTAFTCSKLTIETLEQCVNLFKVNNKNNRTSSTDVVRLSLLSIYFTGYSCVFIVVFEQVNFSCDVSFLTLPLENVKGTEKENWQEMG